MTDKMKTGAYLPDGPELNVLNHLLALPTRIVQVPSFKTSALMNWVILVPCNDELLVGLLDFTQESIWRTLFFLM